MAHPQLNWCTPMEKGLGVTPDISPFLQFEWYEPVLFLNNNDGFPSTKERKGYWCGPTVNVGDAMTYWILTDDTKQLIARSNVHSALTPDVSASNVSINFRDVFSNDFEGSPPKAFVTSAAESTVSSASTNDDDNLTAKPTLTSLTDLLSELSGKPINTIIDPNYLLGYSFVTDHDDIKQRATIVDLGDKVTLQFLNGSKSLMEYLINIINAQDEDGPSSIY